MVYYRKYRPQQLSELDLANVREKLLLILKNKNIAHAFLFTGPKGLGKTSSARILAKAINCEKHIAGNVKMETKKTTRQEPTDSLQAVEPCNKCEACISITGGSNIDVLEIDAASNRGIDEIRDLRDRVKFAPSNLRYKVYIIDEVHMLTTDAFNALLKTLEEPPSHVVFVLCTTEMHKIPHTILSRAFNISFQKPTKEELLGSLQRIIDGEKLDVEKGVLETIYDLSEGSFRDAAKILEELSISSSGGKITTEIAESIFKNSTIEREVENLVLALSVRNAKGALEIIQKLVDVNCDFKTVAEKIVGKFHQLLLVKTGLLAGNDINEFTISDIEYAADLFNDAYKNIRFSVFPSLSLELAAVRFCTQNSVLEKQEAAQVEKPEADKIAQQGLNKTQVEKPEAKSKEPEAGYSHGDLFKPTVVSDNFFSELITRVKKDNHSISGVLRGCRMVSITDDQVVIETKFKFHKDKLSETKTLAILEKRSSEILAKPIKVAVAIAK